MKKDTEITFQVFDYVEDIDAFIINPKFDEVAQYLGLKEWHSTVWIGRYFTLDSDYGEHWFDNWSLRDIREAKAQQLGIRYDDLMVIDPSRFKMPDYRGDGPCHTDEQIKLFWTDVLKSLKLSLTLLIEEAIKNQKQLEEAGMNKENSDQYVPDLEERIKQIRNKNAST